MTSSVRQEVEPANLPSGGLQHIAIIMDGNGRWAAARRLPRAEGHRRGVEAVRRTVRAAAKFGIRYLTIYSFSSENWSRPRQEIDALFELFKLFVRRDLAQLAENGVRVRVIGRREGLPDDLLQLIEFSEAQTRHNTRLDLVVAFNYGARDEIARAAQAVARRVASGEVDIGDIDEHLVARHLDTADIPDPDLVVRTSGEVRLSNFLMWQCAYSEFVFLPVLWPDFGEDDLAVAIDEFHTRSRRYGGSEARSSA